MKRRSIAAAVLLLLVAITPQIALAQFQGATISPLGQNAAPVPQYWVADALIFSGNAAQVAAILASEGNVNIESPQMIGNQAIYMTTSIGRALADLNSLLVNAMNTNPVAVPPIRQAIAQLVAAQADAQVVINMATTGRLGPIYQTTVVSAQAHLRAADRAMAGVASAYHI